MEWPWERSLFVLSDFWYYRIFFFIDYSLVYDFKLFWVQFLLYAMMCMLHSDIEVDYNQVEWVNEDYLI